MTNKEKYKRTFSALHASGNDFMEEEIMKKRKDKYMKKIVAAAAAVVIVSGSMTAAYAADLGGIQEKLTMWFHGEETEVNVNRLSENSYKYTFTDSDGKAQEFVAGGVEIDDQGNERPATAQEVLEATSDEVVFSDSGRIYLYYNRQQKKADITELFNKKGVCRVSAKDGGRTVYYDIDKDGGFTMTGETPEHPEHYTFLE